MENVLFLLNHAGKAGTERYVRTLAENAPAFGMRPFFAYNEPGLLSETLSDAGVPCRRLEMRGPYDFRAARNLSRICEELRIGVIQTNYLRENYIAILTKIFFQKNLRIIYTNHFVTPNSLSIKLANKIMTPMDHKIISVCEAGIHRLIKNGNHKKKIVVIHNAVDPLAWKPGSDYMKIRMRTRRDIGVGDNEKVFLCASRFAHDKGHMFLIDSLAEHALAYGTHNLRVVLAGDGPLAAQIREYAEERGLSDIVMFIGFVKDMRSIFYASDAYVNPSEHEALSFLILEALASGLPVIAADMGGNREIVNKANGCGVLVKYGDAAALSEAIRVFRMDDGLLPKMKENAYRTIKEKFSLNDMLAKTFASFY